MKSNLLRREYERYRARRANRTTLIIGMRCSDGVALVADKKIFDADTGRSTYNEKKIIDPLNLPVMVGASGLTDSFREFQRKIPIVVKTHKRELDIKNQKALQEIDSNSRKVMVPPYGYTGEHFLDDCKQLIQEISEEKKKFYPNSLEVLLGFRSEPKVPVLFYIDWNGLETQIRTYKAIGSSYQYATLFFDRLWKRCRSITEGVALACFVIKFVEKMKLDNFVGVGKSQVPQIALIPNKGEIGYLSFKNKELFLKDAGQKIKKLDEVIRGFSFPKLPITRRNRR